MHLVIERAKFLQALGHATSIVERRTTIPILSHVLLKAAGQSIEVHATDLERAVAESVPADVRTPGALTAPALLLHEIVRKLPEGAEIDMQFDADRQRVTLTAGAARFALQTLPAPDFPDLAVGELTHRFEMAAKDLRRLIEKARFAISTEETRYYLNGIYFHIAKYGDRPVLRAVATDGHRLARVEHDCPPGAEGMPGVIVPRKTVHEVHRLIEDTADMVKVGVSNTKIRFEMGDVVLTSKLIDGTFPDYARVIPLGNDKEMTVPNAAFKSAVDRVSTISSERGRAVKLNLGPGKLLLSVNNPDGGSATEELDATYSAPPLEIGFNARYLLDIADQLDGEQAHFLLADPGSPTIIKDTASDAALYVLMPMRV